MGFFQGFKVKALVIVGLVHVGFFAGVGGLLMMRSPEGESHPMFWPVLGIILAAYFATLLTTYFIYAPVAPWVQRARQLSDWKSWVVKELPAILTLVPVVVAGVRAIKRRKKGQPLPLEKVGAVISDLLNLDSTPGTEAQPAPRRRASHPKRKKSNSARKSSSTRPPKRAA